MIKTLKTINLWINKRYELGYDAIRLLRIKENIAENKYNKILLYFIKIKYKKLCKKNGAFIRLTTSLGNGISFPHGISGIFISQGAHIGDNCVIFQQVTIGSNTLTDSVGCGSPTIGNNVYIGAGAKIIGNVHIGDNVRIGANAIITKDISPNSTVVMEAPRIILHEKTRTNDFVEYSMENG